MTTLRRGRGLSTLTIMPGSGLYKVGLNQQYRTVGAAVDALINDQGFTPFTAEQEIRIVESGVYPPFQVPASVLTPTSTHRLKISASSGVNATISGRLVPDRAHFGAAISSPYTTVEKLRIRDVSKGLVFANGANYGKALQNRVENCSNVGLWADQVSYFLAAHCALIENNVGLSVTAGQEMALIHNTIYQRQGKTAGIFWDIVDGYVYIYSNNIVCLDHPCLKFPRNQWADKLLADWNNYWSPGSSVVVQQDVDGNGTLFDTHYVGYQQWTNQGNQDYHSMSTDPAFVNEEPAAEYPDLDVRLLAGSPLARGSIYWGDDEAVSYLPSHVAKADLIVDRDGASRNIVTEFGQEINDRVQLVDLEYSVTTVGAFNLPVKTDYFSADIFAEDASGEGKSVVQRSAQAYADHVECWFPRVHRGTFWIRDREYYLYAQKAGLTLQDVAVTSWNTSVHLIGSTVRAFIGETELDQSSFDVHGPKVLVKHKDLDIESMNQQVRITGEYYEWNSSNHSFIKKTIEMYLRLRDGETKYILPTEPKDAGPIVVTDDTIGRLDDRSLLQQQFRVERTEEGVELKFRHRNMLLNPDFHYGIDAPADWIMTSDVGRLTSVVGSTRPCRGGKFLVLTGGPDTGKYVGQAVSVDPDQQYYLSLYARGSGSLQVQVDYYDPLSRELTGYTRSVALQDSSWERLGVSIGSQTSSVIGQVTADVGRSLEAVPMHTGAAYAMVKLSSDTGHVDCVQLEEGFVPSKFTSLPRGGDMTIEYESSDALFHQAELALNPIRNANHAGFLYIGSVPARQFDTGAPVDATTLSDWQWGKGRTDVLPWAKLHGINKLRRVVQWNTDDNFQVPRESSPGLPIGGPSEVTMFPSRVVARQGQSGEHFTVDVRDSDGNPYAHERVTLELFTENGAFPGYLSTKKWGYHTQLGQKITGYTNERGQMSVKFIPPGSDRVEYRGAAPSSTGSLDTGSDKIVPYSYVDVPYTVSPFNHGNPTIHQEDGTIVTIAGRTTVSRIWPEVQNGHAVYDLTGGYPTPNSVLVQVENSTGGLSYPLEESRNEVLGSSHFFTDYEDGRISIKGTTRAPARIIYKPRSIWRDPRFPQRLYFDAAYLNALTGDLVVRYDGLSKLLITAQPREGLSTGSSAWRLFDELIMQNPNRGDV